MRCPSDPKLRKNNKFGICRYAIEKGFGGLEDFKEDHTDAVTIMTGYDHSMDSRDEWMKGDPTKFDQLHCLMCHVSLRSKKDDRDMVTENVVNKNEKEVLEEARALSIKYIQSLCGLEKWLNTRKESFPIIQNLKSIWGRKQFGHILCVFLASHNRTVELECGLELDSSPSLKRACCPHCRKEEADMVLTKHKKYVKSTSGVGTDEITQFSNLRQRLFRLGVIRKDEEELQNLLCTGPDMELPSRGTRARAAIQLWARSTLVGAVFGAKEEQSKSTNIAQGFQDCHIRVLRDIHQSKVLTMLCLSEAFLNTSLAGPQCHDCDRKNSDWISHMFTSHRGTFFEFVDLLVTNAMKIHEEVAEGTYQWDSFRTSDMVELNVIHSVAIMITVSDSADLMLHPVHLSSLKASVVTYSEEADDDDNQAGFNYSSVTRLIDRWRMSSTSVKDRDWSNVIKVEHAPKVSGWGLDFYRYINRYPQDNTADFISKEDGEDEPDDVDIYDDESYFNEELESDLLEAFKTDIWTFCGLSDIKLKDPKEIESSDLQKCFLGASAQFCITNMAQPPPDELALKTLWIRKRLKDRLEEYWLSSMPGGVGEEAPSLLDVFGEFDESYQDFRKNNNESEMNDLRKDLKRLRDLQWQISSVQALQRLFKSGHYIKNAPGTPWDNTPNDRSPRS